MVSITNKHSGQSSKDIPDLDAWIGKLASQRPVAEVDVIRRACALAEQAHHGQKRVSGEPYVQHALAVGRGLASFITGGSWGAIDLQALSPERVQRNQPLREVNVI